MRAGGVDRSVKCEDTRWYNPLAWAEPLRRYERTQGSLARTPPVLLSFPQDAKHRRCAAAIPEWCHTSRTYISHITMRDICCQGALRSQDKRRAGCLRQIWEEGLRGYVPTSSYVSMARQRESSDPAKLQARLAEDERAGTLACVWTLETRRALHCCHRNEAAQPVNVSYYCMADARRVVRPGLPCVFPCGPTGQAGS